MFKPAFWGIFTILAVTSYATVSSAQEIIEWVGYQDGCAGQLLQPFDASWGDGNQWYNYQVPTAADIAVFDIGFDPDDDGVPTSVHFEPFHAEALGVGCFDHHEPTVNASVGLVDILNGEFEFLMGDEFTNAGSGGGLWAHELSIRSDSPYGFGYPYASLLVRTSSYSNAGSIEGLDINAIPFGVSPSELDNYDPARVEVLGGQLVFDGASTEARFSNASVYIEPLYGLPGSLIVQGGAELSAYSSRDYSRRDALRFDVGAFSYGSLPEEQDVFLQVDGVGSRLYVDIGDHPFITDASEIRAVPGSTIAVSNDGYLSTDNINSRGTVDIQSRGFVSARATVRVSELNVTGVGTFLYARGIRDSSDFGISSSVPYEDIAAILTVTNGGRIDAGYIVLDENDTLLISGGARVDTHSTTIGGEARISSDGMLTANFLVMSSGGLLDVSAGAAVLGSDDMPGVSGELQVPGGSFNADGILLGDVVATGGRIEVGSLSVSGDAFFLQDSRTHFLIAETSNSSLAVDGELRLEGNVELELEDGYSPQVGEQFVIATGNVAGLPNATLSGGAASRFKLVYTAQSVVAEVVPFISIGGDFNSDGIVDAADYTVWRDGLGTLYSQDDYLDWRTNYGNSVPEVQAAEVPTPTAAFLAALTCAGALGRRRRLFLPNRPSGGNLAGGPSLPATVPGG